MNERLKSAALPAKTASASAACWAMNDCVESAVSYCIHASGHSLIAAAVCAAATTVPQTSGCFQMTHRWRPRKNRPTAMPPAP